MPVDSADIEIGPYRPGDEASILAGFQACFGVPRDPADWRWTYLDNPEGTHLFVGREPSGRVVVQYAAIPRRVRIAGAGEFVFGEIVDSFLLPEYRQGLRREGLFAKTCHAFVDHFGHRDRELVMYGFPVPTAFRIGQRLMGYHPFHQVLLNARDLTPASRQSAALPGGGSVRAIDAFTDEHASVARAVLAAVPMHLVRSAAVLNWRYLQRPMVRYEASEVRDAEGALLGYFVLRHGWRGEAATAVADLVLPVSHPIAREVVQWIEASASAAGSKRAYAMFRPGAPEAMGLAHLGWSLEASDFRWVGRTYDPAIASLERLTSDWWATLGDFDVV